MRLVIVFIIATMVFFAYIFFARNSELDTFAQRYADFRNKQYDTLIYSYVVTIDASAETGEENYFTYLSKALDTTQTDDFRVNGAELALAAYHTSGQDEQVTFSNSIGMDMLASLVEELDSSVLHLVESANMISDDEYRLMATKISENARSIQERYSSLYLEYSARYNLQIKLLELLIEKDGDIYALGSVLSEAGEEVPEINKNIENLTAEVDVLSRGLEDLYFAFKGRTGINSYPDRFIENQ